MKCLLVYGVLLVSAITRGQPTNVLQNRVTGGELAVLGQLPYQVGLKLHIGDKIGFCGGTLISNRTILTAAHCCERADSAKVILGSVLIDEDTEPSRVSINVVRKNIVVHQNWSPLTLSNDICLIILPEPVEFNEYVQPAKLPASEAPEYTRELAIASGWGKESDNATSVSLELRYLEARIMWQKQCKILYLGIIGDTHICLSGLAGKSPCSGDSGGPLVLKRDKRTVVGITSFGIAFGCEVGWPSAYTRVSKFIPWIKTNMS